MKPRKMEKKTSNVFTVIRKPLAEIPVIAESVV